MTASNMARSSALTSSRVISSSVIGPAYYRQATFPGKTGVGRWPFDPGYEGLRR